MKYTVFVDGKPAATGARASDGGPGTGMKVGDIVARGTIAKGKCVMPDVSKISIEIARGTKASVRLTERPSDCTVVVKSLDVDEIDPAAGPPEGGTWESPVENKVGQ